jgi:flagellin
MLAIKNNIMAANAARHLGKAYDALAKSVERLSSGLRINSAKDDAAGLAVRELIRADIAVLQQGARNARDGVSMLQTMEGAMAVIDENLVRMKELAEQAATGSYSAAQRTIMDAEFTEMANEIERISGNTKFNDIAMLNEDPLASGANDVKIHVGTTTTIDIEKVNMTKDGLNIDTGDGGWQITSDTANGVTATSATWMTVQRSSSGGAAASVTLTISFEDNDASANDESDIIVPFLGTTSSAGATTYSLSAVVAAINAKSMDLGWDASGNDLRYSAAETYYDSTNSRYALRLKSRDSTSDEYTMVISGVDTGGGDGHVCGGFTVSSTGGSVTNGMANSGVTQAGLNIKTVDAATTALTTIGSAISTKDTARASFGYKMNRLESTVKILDIQAENLMAAESRISDVDVATEMAELTSTQVLSQAGTAMLAQANAMPQMALTLLR